MKKLVKMVMVAVVVSVLAACGNGGGGNKGIHESRMEYFVAHKAIPGAPMWIGDSITQLWGDDPTWPVGWTNRGIAGDTIGNIKDRIAFHLNEQPGQIVLEAGANNFNTDVKDFEAQLGSVMQTIIAANVPLTVVSTFPQAIDERSERMRQFNDATKLLCDMKNVRFVQVYDDFLKDGKFNQALFRDTVHPNGAGYYELSHVLKEKYVID